MVSPYKNCSSIFPIFFCNQIPMNVYGDRHIVSPYTSWYQHVGSYSTSKLYSKGQLSQGVLHFLAACSPLAVLVRSSRQLSIIEAKVGHSLFPFLSFFFDCARTRIKGAKDFGKIPSFSTVLLCGKSLSLVLWLLSFSSLFLCYLIRGPMILLHDLCVSSSPSFCPHALLFSSLLPSVLVFGLLRPTLSPSPDLLLSLVSLSFCALFSCFASIPPLMSPSLLFLAVFLWSHLFGLICFCLVDGVCFADQSAIPSHFFLLLPVQWHIVVSDLGYKKCQWLQLTGNLGVPQELVMSLAYLQNIFSFQKISGKTTFPLRLFPRLMRNRGQFVLAMRVGQDGDFAAVIPVRGLWFISFALGTAMIGHAKILWQWFHVTG